MSAFEALRAGWRRYWLDPLPGARPQLLVRFVLILVAFDAWIDLIPHAGRYGIGGFNVAHFAWLDALAPTPTPALYAGALFFASTLSLTMALTVVHRRGLALLTALYTYSWAMSMLDSYQHHYLLSWILLCFTLLPTERGFVAPLALQPREGAAPKLFTEQHGVTCLALLGVFALIHGVLFTDLSEADWGWLIRVLPLALAVTLWWTGQERREKEARREDARQAPEGARAWSYVYLCVTCAVVYFYTAITKLGSDWREGGPLRQLARTPPFQALEAHARGEGLPLVGVLTQDEFWALAAQLTIASQLVISAAYLIAARRDAFPLRQRVGLSLLGLVPIAFHVGSELMGLQIGWFSHYMLLIAITAFAPLRWLQPIAELIDALGAAIAARLPSRKSSAIFWGLGLAFAAWVGAEVDLPGALAGTLLGALTCAGFALRAAERSGAHHAWLGVVIAAAALLWSAESTTMRYDYYRWVGGDHRRRQEYRPALEAYEKANLYAPAGQDRREAAAEMRRLLGED